ncbi:aldehyde dehydrogenase family protein [Limibacter armeniacum]|uniref:aldehyde dehydrogenase family protein n=1 Tax=Limibacter armeniacum TaxID=466084 RepID=UPI002FE6BD29
MKHQHMITTTPTLSAVQIKEIFELQKSKAPEVKLSSVKERVAKLRRLLVYMLDHRTDLEQAVYNDFQKPFQETALTEIYTVSKDIKHTIRHLKGWLKPKKVSTPLAMLGSSSKVYFEPKGVALILAPWNYPFYLTIGPLIYAIAAGNCAMVKPSELTPHTSLFIEKMLRNLFPKDEVCVIQGGIDVSTELLKLKFDHIYFTGSPQVGKIVMEAAAKHLTSVTLELGGKSPVIVDDSADLEDTAAKVMWGKMVNAGQTCIAPDYLMVSENKLNELLPKLKEAIKILQDPEGRGVKQSTSFARIINEKHFYRLRNLIDDAVDKGANVVYGGEVDLETKYIAPTILTNVTPDMQVMKEEIFGPVLPIMTYTETEEALSFVAEGEKPLAFYLFCRNRTLTELIIKNTTAGSTCINDCLVQLANPNLPFGGVNNSGIGKGNGYYGFLEFVNQRSVLKQRVGFTGIKLFYPPYTEQKGKMLDMLIKWL